jgi:shikimate dehydrogenase
MKKFGLIGKSISYSFSRKYFSEKFEKEGLEGFTYENVDLENLDSISEIFKNGGFSGMNVTIPYKQDIMPKLDEVDGDAAEIGAVNTISIINGKTKGYNTDSIGFKNSIKPFFEPHHSKALIFGSGGASKAVAHVLKQLGVNYFKVSRNPNAKDEISYSDLTVEAIANYPFLINCTPIGTHPNVDSKLDIPYQGIGPKHLIYDLVYNPSVTAFMKEGLDRGATAVNGLSMLQQQAEKAWEIWNNN